MAISACIHRPSLHAQCLLVCPRLERPFQPARSVPACVPHSCPHAHPFPNVEPSPSLSPSVLSIAACTANRCPCAPSSPVPRPPVATRAPCAPPALGPHPCPEDPRGRTAVGGSAPPSPRPAAGAAPRAPPCPAGPAAPRTPRRSQRRGGGPRRAERRGSRMAAGQRRGTAAAPLALALGLLAVAQAFGDQNQGAVFLREFTLIRRESLHDDFLSDLLNNHKTEDPSSRIARSEEDRDSLWDAWGSWSECSRTCGGGASYSLRRCLSSKTCEGRNIRYRTCSNVDCPPEAGDFRAQQCSAHNDVKYQGQLYEWLPISNDPDNPCSLKCQARGTALVVELAPKVLDGTRCYTESLDMCISGLCQIVGCDHQLGSAVKEDNCGVCNGDGSTCRLVRGQYKSQLSASKLDDTVVAIPYGSRQIRLVLKGPDHLYLETKTLQGVKSENSLSTTGSFLVENSSIDFQKFPDKEILRISGPLTADFTIKIHYAGAADSSVQFIFYQPIIHRWRETDFFPCSASCGGGYQLTSAECFDLRSNRVVADQYCHYYPENIKPKPKLQECNLDPCPARWESTPWTACSSSCGGGIQSRSVSCVEEDIQGHISPVEEWKCMYTPKMPVVQPCNIFDCPKWLAQEWSPCTVTCGQGLRYRVVLCIDHRGMHTGGCSSKTKPHIKEECVVPTPCYKPKEKLPVEAKLPWYKQAQELEEGTAVSEEPSFIPEAWSTCSVTCGVGSQMRLVKCQVLLSFSQSVADLPMDECEGPKPVSQRACYSGPCSGEATEHTLEETQLLSGSLQELDELYDWEYEGFTECSESCGGGVQEAVVTCLNKQTREIAEETLCVSSRRPPQLLKSCSLDPCPPRWEIGNWSTCSLTCGVGLQTRDVFCSHLLSRETNETVILADELCSKPKPSLVQACNRFDCPPSWYPTEWQECSQTCGGGVQKRDALCKQRRADGSLLELPETFCSMPRTITQQACKNEDCPNEWLLSDWTQCSVSCGEGTQSRNAICRKMLKTRGFVIINSSLCLPLPFSSLIRPCSLGPCARHNRPAHKQSPHIMAVKQVYIQTRKQKKLHFIVGGYAYLLPKTSVVLRCPTRRFRKSMITWEKDDKRLVSSAHITIAPYEYVKIHHLKPSDTGTYTCTAGPAREHFIIKLIGSNKKIISGQPAGIREEEAMTKAGLNDALRTEDKHLNGIFFNGSKPEKQGHLANPSRWYDNIVSRLLQLRGWPVENLESWEAQESVERNASSEEDQSQEHSLPFTMVTEQKRLDDIIRNLSQQPEELKDIYTEHLIIHLAHEVFKSYLDHQESVLKASRRKVYSASAEYPFHRRVSGFTSSLRTSSAETFIPTSVDLANGLHRPHQKPAILRKISAAQQLSASEVVTHLGQTVVLASGTLSVLLHCEAVGNPKPTISWAKNGEEVKYNDRLLLQPDDSLQILAPVEADVGFYACNASNALGSDSVSIAVTLAGKPLIKASRATMINTESLAVTVDIGSTLKTIQKANVSINCQVAGVPEAKVTWFKNNVKLSSTHHLHNGLLLIANVSLSDQGLYTCKASNLHGEVTESSQLLVLEPPRPLPYLEDLTAVFSSAGPSTHSVLTSPSGTKLTVSPGTSALIGCAVNGHPTPNITWLYSGEPLSQQHQLLAAGRILQILNVSDFTDGEFSCLAQNEAGSLTQVMTLTIQEYRWSADKLTACSASCGHRGLQLPQLRCLLDGAEVNASHCRETPKPSLQPIACNRRDCPSRWMVTSWSPCTQSCGGGKQTRRVTCQRLTARGSSVPMSSEACAQVSKHPVDTQSCNRQPCVEWAASSWGQCNGPCIGPRLAVQHRQIFCQTKDGTSVSSDQCSSLPRPLSTQNCWTDVCGVHWRVSLWTVCTATCGNYGFQSRRVDCVHIRTNKPVMEHQCSWRPRPANWQRCNITPCENVECRDTTRYCEKVKQLKLCQLTQFKSRCCGTCGKS
ncbi:ADAMTS-like protein 1 isoform X2 [Taeniopygia guttata]|uniref:ADAMTS-like protein 1 isoform X2 n=1 Tax=Taeniopygia guttata TaxID=59729 RepID=UPI003BB856D1